MRCNYIKENLAVVVCFVLFQCARSVPIQKHATRHKRSAETVEFFMNNQLTHEYDPRTGLAFISEQHFNNDLTCPEHVSTGMNDPVYKRSTCPWYYSESRDSKRYPAVIFQAERLCDYAIGSNKMHECVPITESLTVLREQNYHDGNGNSVWVEETITNVVGYTAAGRRLAENSPQATTAAPDNQPTPEWARR
ncbi:uncharacterized protein LOC123528482 [Mercenaria mercenaria]|uniref:uncharacterized protein LOC123528482 n=1 Tax=Mercenaria mercenaria TaxID=6596 RepID=UPI00234E88D5|nr:uncharacterized protein LOC123528482 [Mercenaria mercenaria]